MAIVNTHETQDVSLAFRLNFRWTSPISRPRRNLPFVNTNFDNIQELSSVITTAAWLALASLLGLFRRASVNIATASETTDLWHVYRNTYMYGECCGAARLAVHKDYVYSLPMTRPIRSVAFFWRQLCLTFMRPLGLFLVSTAQINFAGYQ